MEPDLTVVEGVAPEDENIIFERLKAHNRARFGDSNRRELAIPLRNADGEIVGGLTGYTIRDWLYVAMLFVPEELRGRGIASRMLALAEDEARARFCIGAYIDTMNPDALRLYLKLGYREFGRLHGFSGDHFGTWLAKRF